MSGHERSHHGCPNSGSSEGRTGFLGHTGMSRHSPVLVGVAMNWISTNLTSSLGSSTAPVLGRNCTGLAKAGLKIWACVFE